MGEQQQAKAFPVLLLLGEFVEMGHILFGSFSNCAALSSSFKYKNSVVN
jgi:hypothetical protein